MKKINYKRAYKHFIKFLPAIFGLRDLMFKRDYHMLVMQLEELERNLKIRMQEEKKGR